MAAEFCQRLFLHLLRLLYGFIFQFVSMVYHIDWFMYIEESLHSWNKHNLIIVSLGLHGVPWTARRSNQSILKEISTDCSWKDGCWSWNSDTLATWCKELTHLKRPWCCERLKVGREGDNRGWDDWIASLTQWTWICLNSRSWWWTGKSGVLQSMGSQRVGHDWATWTEPIMVYELFDVLLNSVC